MFKLTEDQRNDDLVKSLLEGGFNEEVVAGWIEDGTIKLEKSIPEEDPEEDEKEKPEDGDGAPEKEDDEEPIEKSDDDDLENDEKEIEEESEKEIKKGCGRKHGASIAKSVTAEVLKSLNGMLESHDDDIVKSIGVAVASAVLPFEEKLNKIEKSMNGVVAAIEAFGNVAPSFKSAGLNRAVIEKSIGGKDENEKTVLSVSRDRAVVRTLIEKSIEEEKDVDIQKSLRDQTQAYLLDPLGGAIGEMAARYMYDNKNVRLIK